MIKANPVQVSELEDIQRTLDHSEWSFLWLSFTINLVPMYRLSTRGQGLEWNPDSHRIALHGVAVLLKVCSEWSRLWIMAKFTIVLLSFNAFFSSPAAAVVVCKILATNTLTIRRAFPLDALGQSRLWEGTKRRSVGESLWPPKLWKIHFNGRNWLNVCVCERGEGWFWHVYDLLLFLSPLAHATPPCCAPIQQQPVGELWSKPFIIIIFFSCTVIIVHLV